MLRASRLFSDEEKLAIKNAIGEAEKKTAGEIVPVVATRSGRYDRAEDVFGVALAVVAVAVVWLLFQKVEITGEDWAAAPRLGVGLAVILGVFMIAFVGGALLATVIPALAAPLIGKRERVEEVEKSARRAFYDFRLRGTAQATGILIYVSLFERMVWVIGDTAIHEKIGGSGWNEIRDLIVTGLRGRKPAEGLCAAIARCGELLAEHFPRASDDVNELPNELHVID
jgi:putative membrane protein